MSLDPDMTDGGLHWRMPIRIPPPCSSIGIARGRPDRSLRYRSGKHKYGFHGPWPLTLRICACGRSFSPVPDDPHRKKERPK